MNTTPRNHSASAQAAGSASSSRSGPRTRRQAKAAASAGYSAMYAATAPVAAAAIQPGKTASVSLYHPDHDWLVARLEGIAEHCRAEGLPLRISMSWYYINCDLVHISKATGIDRLLAAHGLARQQLAGIGDTMGDLAIRERVRFFACPANADPRLRAVADYTSPHEVADGVVDILERLTPGEAG